MVIQNNYNRRTKEYFKYDDVLEGFIINNTTDRKIEKCDDCKVKNDSKCPSCTYTVKKNKLNSTVLERRLARINKGSKRRLNNNHSARLQAFKQGI